MKTLLLDRTKWDLVIDVDGNIAVASDPYSQAQDAASEIKTFLGEVYYDTSKGIPYWTQILAQWPSAALVKQKLAAAALLVPGVETATVFLEGLGADRVLRGQVQIRNYSDQASAANI